MKIFDFIKATISHDLKDPHSKALEPGGLSPLLAVTTQPPEGEVGTTRNRGGGHYSLYSLSLDSFV
jgi:hypothetical protein